MKMKCNSIIIKSEFEWLCKIMHLGTAKEHFCARP